MKCEICGKKSINLESAHLLSYHLARFIVFHQMEEPITPQDFRKLKEFIRRIHGKKGEVKMCEECHLRSNTFQNDLLEEIKKISELQDYKEE